MNIVKNIVLCSAVISALSTALHAHFPEPRDYFCPNKILLWGSIQFPKTVSVLPTIRIYYSGQRIKCETNNEAKCISYAIPVSDLAHNMSFNIVITDKLEYTSELNVIKYLKVQEHAPYKFYKADLIFSSPNLCSLEQSFDIESNWRHPKISWDIREYRNGLENNGRIPDDTIIICYKSSYIDRLESTNANATALPTIRMRSDIVQFVGSEKRLHDEADELILSLLDYDTFHAAMHQQEIRPSMNPKTILSITT